LFIENELLVKQFTEKTDEKSAEGIVRNFTEGRNKLNQSNCMKKLFEDGVAAK
jgi:hypothetical protein